MNSKKRVLVLLLFYMCFWSCKSKNTLYVNKNKLPLVDREGKATTICFPEIVPDTLQYSDNFGGFFYKVDSVKCFPVVWSGMMSKEDMISRFEFKLSNKVDKINRITFVSISGHKKKVSIFGDRSVSAIRQDFMDVIRTSEVIIIEDIELVVSGKLIVYQEKYLFYINK